jgi:hypothetical protein
MKKIYRVDVQIAGTAYVKADSVEDALNKIATLNGSALEVAEQDGELAICGRRFNDARLPELSLSPAMTIYGVWPGDKPSEVE